MRKHYVVLVNKLDKLMIVVDGKDYMLEVKILIQEYLTYLGRDLSFQNIDKELNNPAEKYTPPVGEILVAIENNELVGMVAYHKHSCERCEMKRLFVRPKARGKHVGDILVKEIIAHAIKAGYREMVLDTISPLKEAISLYKKHGFIECEAYYNNPMADVIYMRKRLLEKQNRKRVKTILIVFLFNLSFLKYNYSRLF